MGGWAGSWSLQWVAGLEPGPCSGWLGWYLLWLAGVSSDISPLLFCPFRVGTVYRGEGLEGTWREVEARLGTLLGLQLQVSRPSARSNTQWHSMSMLRASMHWTCSPAAKLPGLASSTWAPFPCYMISSTHDDAGPGWKRWLLQTSLSEREWAASAWMGPDPSEFQQAVLASLPLRLGPRTMAVMVL